MHSLINTHKQKMSGKCFSLHFPELYNFERKATVLDCGFLAEAWWPQCLFTWGMEGFGAEEGGEGGATQNGMCSPGCSRRVRVERQ